MVNLMIAGSIVVGIVSILTVVSSWIFARLWCRPQRKNLTSEPDDYDLPFESIEFRSKGVLLKGWFIPFENSMSLSPIIILPHGWSSNASSVLPLAKLLHKAGYAVFVYNARGHGNSGGDGPITLLKFAEDIISGIDYLETRSDIDMKKVGVIGHSLGASATIVAAAMDPRIRVAVSSSSFSDPVQLTRETMKKLYLPRGPLLRLAVYFIEHWLGVPMDSVAPKNLIGKVNAYLLLVHGDSDRFIDPGNLSILYSHANKKKTEFRLIKGAGHSNIIGHLSCGDDPLVRFFNEKLRYDPCRKTRKYDIRKHHLFDKESCISKSESRYSMEGLRSHDVKNANCVNCLKENRIACSNNLEMA